MNMHNYNTYYETYSSHLLKGCLVEIPSRDKFLFTKSRKPNHVPGWNLFIFNYAVISLADVWDVNNTLVAHGLHMGYIFFTIQFTYYGKISHNHYHYPYTYIQASSHNEGLVWALFSTQAQCELKYSTHH